MKVAVVGAGVSGLIAAQDLKAGGADVTVFDKGRSVGGRCATRSTEFGSLDHGLQLLDGNDRRIKEALKRFSCEVKEVAFTSGSYQPIPGPAPYLRPVHGARSFAEAMAQGIDVKTSHTVTSLKRVGSTWSVQCGDDAVGTFDTLVMAIPPQQAAAFGLHDDTLALKNVVYSPQAAALVADTALLDLPETGPLTHEGLAWISLSSDGKRATILSDEPLSSTLMETDKQDIAKLLWQRLGAQGTPAYLSGHRWRYCRVTTAIGHAHNWNEDKSLGYCGDWFIGPNAGDALESGTSLAKAILAG